MQDLNITEEMRPLARLPGDIVNHPVQSFSFTVAIYHNMN